MKKKILATAVAGLLAVTGLAACGDSATQSQAPDANAAVQVIRDYQGELPTVEGEFGKSAGIKPVSAEAPKQVVAKTIKQGEGAVLKETDTVLAHYLGVLWDGTKFDSSFDRSEGANPTPISFSLQQVIKGWTYGLAGQKVGDRVLLVIPAEWGYGETGQGDVIKPGSTLVFVVDIVGAVDPTDLSALKDAKATDEKLEGVTVKGDLGAKPTIELAEGAKLPTDQTVTVLATGNGAEVNPDDYVFYHIVAFDVASKTESGTSWTNEPARTQRPVGDAPGVTGLPVGSRSLVYMPANKDTNSPEALFVVDIIATMPSK